MKKQIIKYVREREDGSVVELECVVYWKRSFNAKPN